MLFHIIVWLKNAVTLQRLFWVSCSNSNGFSSQPDTFVPSPQRSLAKGGCLETEDALAMDTSQTSSFKYESEMLHIEIKEEEDILDESTSSNSGNETGKDVNEQATPHKDAPALSKKDKRFTCQLCGKNFCNKFSLTRHKWSHSKTTTTCKYCNKIFKNRESRQRHEKMHEEGNRYQCHLCDKSYVSSTSHAAHVRKHTGECPYKCSECNATFYLLSSFERHVVKHRGVKEYECEICTASFWVPDDLRAHVNRMHWCQYLVCWSKF